MHLLFAWRYFKAKKTTNAINIIAWVSIGAIILGTAALILVLSVFNGFEGLVKSLYSTFYPDLKVLPASGKLITLNEQQLQQLRGLTGIRNFSLVVEEKVLLQTYGYDGSDSAQGKQVVVQLKGVDDNYKLISGVPANLIQENFDLGTEDQPKLVLGVGVADALDINSSNHVDPVWVYLPRRDSSELLNPLESISQQETTVSDAFAIQQDFDNKYGITNISFIKSALKWQPNEYSAVEIALKDADETERVASELEKILGPRYQVLDKYQQNKSLYAVMNLERWAIYGVLCLILVVAAFNMIGALTMLVLEKQKDISVLHALGANRGFIRKIFLSEGILLAVIGGITGMVLATIVALLQINFHLIPLAGGSFLIDYFPVRLRLFDYVLVGTTVFVIALIASLIPSRKAAGQEFVLRSE